MKNKTLTISVAILGLTITIAGVVFELLGNNSSDTNNKTICTYKSESSGVNITETYTLLHKDNKLKSYNKSIKYKYTKNSEEAALRYKGDWIKSQVQMSNSVNGIDITHKEEKYTIINSFDYNLEVFNAEENTGYTDIYPSYTLDTSIDTIVKELEGWEFSCKTK